MIVDQEPIYTQAQGMTAPPRLLHGGRVSEKGDELVDAYGDIDEAAATLGAGPRRAAWSRASAGIVLRLQRQLFATAARPGGQARASAADWSRDLPGRRRR